MSLGTSPGGHGNLFPSSARSTTPVLGSLLTSPVEADGVIRCTPEVGSVQGGVQPDLAENGSAQPQKETEKKRPSLLKTITRNQLSVLLVLCFARVCSAALGSLLAPFFPNKAVEKGASKTEVGLIFGAFQLIMFIAAPVFGHYLTRIGPKFMFISGNIVLSTCGILFGVLLWCPDGSLFVGMCFLVRSVEALGAAAQGTANLAIASHMFPEHVSSVMGILELFMCLGLMLGPVIGGTLYRAWNYFLPFVVMGTLSIIPGWLSICLLNPPQGKESEEKLPARRKLSLLTVPIVYFVGFMLFMGQAAIGYMDVALSPQLLVINENISATTIGLIFLIPTGVVVILAPIYGWMVDKMKWLGRPMLIMGTIVGGLCLLAMGPLPLLPLPSKSETLLIIALTVCGIGWASMVVSYQEFVYGARRKGLPETMDTQGIISGTFNAVNSLGAFVGPTAGGFLEERLGFAWSTSVIGAIVIVSGLLLFLYSVVECAILGRCTIFIPPSSIPSEEEEITTDVPSTEEDTEPFLDNHGISTHVKRLEGEFGNPTVNQMTAESDNIDVDIERAYPGGNGDLISEEVNDYVHVAVDTSRSSIQIEVPCDDDDDGGGDADDDGVADDDDANDRPLLSDGGI